MKLLGVRSLIFYATQSAAMLVPTREPKVSEFDYIEQLPIYGSRGWCRVEFFIFALTNEMARSERGVQLFAASTTGATRHSQKWSLRAVCVATCLQTATCQLRAIAS